MILGSEKTPKYLAATGVLKKVEPKTC